MGSLAEPVEKYSEDTTISFSCDADTDISKGALLKLTDNRTAAAADGDGDVIAGIAAMDKDADDDSDTISVYTQGIFLMEAGTSISVGDNVSSYVTTGSSNEVGPANSTQIQSKIIGTALEAGTDGDMIEVKLDL